MNGLLLAALLGAGALSNFPREAPGKITQAAIQVSLGGQPAVVVPAGEQLAAFRADGGTPPGFPVTISSSADESASGPAGAADMDGDGKPEIAVATTAGRVFLVGGGAGWPAKLGAKVRAGVSFGDVDGDGRPELLVGDERGRVHALKRNGVEAKGFPLPPVGSPVTSPVVAGQLGAARVLVFGCQDGKVHVLGLSGAGVALGKERPGFPLVTQYAVTGVPALADLDDDGVLDLIVASQDFKVYAVTAQGEPLPGFPVSAGYRIYEGPAVADLEGDGKLDVIFASADGMVHAVSRAGAPLPGFPVRAGARVMGGPAIGDLTREGALDVVVVSYDGNVHAFAKDGKPLPGFPASTGGAEVTASPLLADLAGDGMLSVFVGVPGGDLHAVRATRAGNATAAVPWSGPGRDAARSGKYGPYPPSYKELRLDPATPGVGDPLKVSFRSVWLDAPPGAEAPAPRITWYRDGKAVHELDGKRELPAGTARRGERWHFALAAPTGAALFEGPEVSVRNTAPGAPEVAIEPARPLRSQPARAVILRPAVDPDGDKVSYKIEWLVDGVPIGVTGENFPGEKLRKGALVGIRVTPSDGELEGPQALALARVADTPPGPLEVALEPAQPRRDQPIVAKITKPATDADEDPISYEYRWTVNGEVRNLPAGAAELPPGLFAKHQTVKVEVRATDGELTGPPATAEVKVLNSVPTAPVLVVKPEEPHKGDQLRAVIAQPAQDPDVDPIAYRFTWKKNGQAFTGAQNGGREIPGSAVARDDKFEVTVVANDGEVDGPPASAAVKVVNTLPLPPRVAIEPRHPKGGETLKLVVVEPPTDADGDTVLLANAWTRNGDATGGNSTTLAPKDFKKHERVRVTVTPRDRFGVGLPATDEVEVDDAPPTAPVLAFTTERPTVGAPLEVVVKTPAQDADGDALTYRYRWLRDGVPVAVPAPDGVEASKTPPFWTASPRVPVTELKKGQVWEVQGQAFDGELYGPIARATVTIVNTPPPAPRLALVRERPRRVDGIVLRGSQDPDADGDFITYRYAWTRNGQRFDAPADQAQIPRGLARKGDRWSVEVIASDGEMDSPPARLELSIGDSPPGATLISLCDGPVPAGTVPEARIVKPSVDPDGDTVSYVYEWSLNGRAIAAAKGQTRFTAQPLRKHDLLRLTVTPFDGELAGPPAGAECQVVNTPPGPPEIALSPAEPTALTGVQVVVKKASADRDGDQVAYRYAWSRGGLPVPFDGPAIPADTLRHGETWRVEVTPFDGEEPGAPVSASVTVKNTPPATPSVLLVPEVAGVGQELTCQVKAAPKDADQEPVALHYRWSRNGQAVPVAEDADTLPAGIVRRGEKWRCEVWGSDGFADGPHAAAELTIRNTAPTAPQVVVEPERPHRRDALACRIAVASVDRDGDPVTYTYAWTRNGKPATASADPSRIEAGRIAKEERWRCTATPGDGTATGPAGVAERVVLNTPPGPARVRLQPSLPKAGQPLRCELTAKSEDEDGDAVRYRFVWVRNGSVQPFAESSQEVPGRLIKPGDRWRCRVTPTDGRDDGPESSSEEAVVPEAPATLGAVP